MSQPVKVPFLKRVSAGGRRPYLQERPDGPILIAAAPIVSQSSSESHWPLAQVLVVDVEGFGLPNDGASATNAMEAIVATYGPAIAQVCGTPVQQTLWAECDSVGSFCHVYPDWPDAAGLKTMERVSVCWGPIRLPPGAACQATAFAAATGPTGAALLEVVLAELGLRASASEFDAAAAAGRSSHASR